MGDDFLRLLLCRHVFASCVLRAHRSFRGRGTPFQPSSRPPLPDLDLIENPTLQRYALDLAAQLDVRHLFVDSCGEVDWWRPSVGVAGATSSYPTGLIGSDVPGRDGFLTGRGITPWAHSRIPRPAIYPRTAYNSVTQYPSNYYMGGAGVSNVRGRRRYYSGTGIVPLGGELESRLGYEGTYSSSINALHNLPSSYGTPTANPALPRHYPSHHSSSYSSLPLMSASPPLGISNVNPLLGNFGTSGLYGRYPSSTAFINAESSWRRWLIATSFNLIFSLWPKVWTNCVLMIHFGTKFSGIYFILNLRVT